MYSFGSLSGLWPERLFAFWLLHICMSNYLQTVAPSDTLVSLAELKAHLAIEHNEDDARLTLMLETARDLIETELDLSLVSQTWKQIDPYFYAAHRLGKLPASTVTVQYYDADDTLQTLDSSNYRVIESYMQATLFPVNSWPTTYSRHDAVQITIEAGFASVPGAAKQACLMLCATWNELREAEQVGSTSEVGLGYERLIKSLRRGYIA